MGVLDNCLMTKMNSFLMAEDFLIQSAVSGSMSSMEALLST